MTHRCVNKKKFRETEFLQTNKAILIDYIINSFKIR